MKITRLRFLLGMVCLGLLAAATTATGTTISSSSSGYGVSVDLDALTSFSLEAGPWPAGANGMAPGPYNTSDSDVDVMVTSNTPMVADGIVAADAVNGTATSDVDGLDGDRTTSASGGVVGAEIDVTTLPAVGAGINLVGVDGTLSSSAMITGDHGTLNATGTTTIESLSLVVNDITVDLAAFVGVSVAPNTVVDLAILGLVGATLTLNEQTIAPDNSSIEVNAFHLTLGLLDIGGEVILGHSEASVSTVPEPSVVSLLAMVLAPLMMTRVRQA